MNWDEALTKYAQYQAQFQVDTKRTAEEKVLSEITGIKYLLDELPEIRSRNVEDITSTLWHDETLVKYIKRNQKYLKCQDDVLKWAKYQQLVRCFILARDAFKCHYCGRDGLQGIPLQRDHKIPKSTGGGEYIDNMVCSCTFCNMAKGQSTEEEFIDILVEVAKAVLEKYPERFK